MSDPLPFLFDVQTGVVRGVNAPIVTYLFFRITDQQKFVQVLPSAADEPGPENKGNGLGLGATVFHSEAWRILQEARKESAKDGQTTSAARGAASATEMLPQIVPLANVAFTHSGLRKLGVHEKTLQSFPEPFYQGMADRAVVLGDDGPAAPEHWHGYLGSRQIHGVTWGSLFFPDFLAPDLALKLYAELVAQVLSSIPLAIGASGPWQQSPVAQSLEALGFSFEAAPIPGAELLHVEFGFANYRTGDNREPPYRIEHFGFRDGISQPYADIGLKPPPPGGGTPRARDSWAPVARGELLLGHPDEDNLVQHLPANRTLRKNGTYMVFRKLEQDVVGFRNFMSRYNRSGIPDQLASQAVGRWPDGSPFVRYPNGPQSFESAPTAHTVNDFRYQAEDPFGRRCPIGAHIRRVNPRDTNDRDEARRHRVFRRSMSYGGPTLPEGSAGDGIERGLLFISMQARIDRQFEFLQANWLNRGELAGQAGAGLDPLIAPHAGRVCDAFQAVGDAAPTTHLPRFVTLHGGDYFFVPSFTALAALKAKYNFEPDDPSAPMPGDAIGSILPSRTDNSAELIALGKRLLAIGQPSFASLPPITTTPFPGGPSIQVKTIVVGRYDYVKNVLLDDTHFSNGLFDARSRAICGGQGLLIGLPNSDPERAKRLKVLHDALALLGPLPISQVAEGLTQGVLDRVRPTGRLDVVRDFGRVVPIMAAGLLFGIFGPGFVSPTGIATLFGRFDVTDVPDDWLRTLPVVEDYAKPLASMQTWTRLAFLQIFVNVVNSAEISAPAERAVREFLRQVDVLVLKGRENPKPGKSRNLLEALVRVPLDPTDMPDPGRHIRLLLAEFTAGAVETVNAALTNSLNYLMDHREKVKKAICDHLQPGFVCDDKTTLDEAIKQLGDADLDILIYEILRFDPMGPLSFRTCVSTATIGGLNVDPGTIVCLVTAAAMMDPDAAAFPFPDTIRFDRQPDRYLHFGAGLHECKGQMIVNPVVFPIAMPLLRTLFRNIATLPRLRRAAGAAGKKSQTFPLLSDGLTLRFD